MYFSMALARGVTISASVYVNDLVGTLQAKTTILITEGAQECPVPGVPGVFDGGPNISGSNSRCDLRTWDSERGYIDG